MLNVTVIACITDALVIQKILALFDKTYQVPAQAKLLPLLRAPPELEVGQQDFDWGA
jgi:hypothetical protein